RLFASSRGAGRAPALLLLNRRQFLPRMRLFLASHLPARIALQVVAGASLQHDAKIRRPHELLEHPNDEPNPPRRLLRQMGGKVLPDAQRQGLESATIAREGPRPALA